MPTSSREDFVKRAVNRIGTMTVMGYIFEERRQKFV